MSLVAPIHPSHHLTPAAVDWRDAVEAVLGDPSQPALVFQPIVDLRLGVIAGYEVLARFAGPPAVTPDRWFAEADHLGLGARLEAHVVRQSLAVRDDVPADCFLAINVSPHLMGEPDLAEALLEPGDLAGVVLELTEHVPVGSHTALTELLGRLRARGASIALDDAGSGYSGLQQLALVRPDIVKLDRALVDHADRDEAKLALAHLLGSYAGRLDACLLAEGIERPEELEAFIRLGVPLGQGWLFGRGTATFAALPERLAARVRDLAARVRRLDEVSSLVEIVPSVTQPDADRAAAALFAADPGLDMVVVVDPTGRPWQLIRSGFRADDPGPGDPDGAGVHVSPVSLRVPVTANLVDVATRAMTRDPAQRFDPVIGVDEAGRFLGLVRVERLTLRLAELHDHGATADLSTGSPLTGDPTAPPTTRSTRGEPS